MHCTCSCICYYFVIVIFVFGQLFESTIHVLCYKIIKAPKVVIFLNVPWRISLEFTVTITVICVHNDVSSLITAGWICLDSREQTHLWTLCLIYIWVICSLSTITLLRYITLSAEMFDVMRRQEWSYQVHSVTTLAFSVY